MCDIRSTQEFSLAGGKSLCNAARSFAVIRRISSGVKLVRMATTSNATCSPAAIFERAGRRVQPLLGSLPFLCFQPATQAVRQRSYRSQLYEMKQSVVIEEHDQPNAEGTGLYRRGHDA